MKKLTLFTAILITMVSYSQTFERDPLAEPENWETINGRVHYSYIDSLSWKITRIYKDLDSLTMEAARSKKEIDLLKIQLDSIKSVLSKLIEK